MARFYSGDNLVEVLDVANEYRKNALQFGQFVTIRYDILIQMCVNLLGNAKDPLVLTGDTFNESEAIEFNRKHNPLLMKAVLVGKHLVAVYMNQMQLAIELAEDLARNVETNKGANLVTFAITSNTFLHGLACASLSKNCVDYKRRALSSIGKLRGLAEHSPENCLHKLYLVEAEFAHNSGLHEDAAKKYRLSIELAGKQGYLHEEALANDRAGRAFQSCGKSDEAAIYFDEARRLYGRWGGRIVENQLPCK